ncbi:MAG: hypothetical protein WCH04_01570 [Gammaproteobacteria bacterium]
MPGNRRRSDTGDAQPVSEWTAASRSSPVTLVNYRGININRRRFIASVYVAGLFMLTRTAAGRPSVYTRHLTALMDRLAPAIEALTERTTPANWELLHACLYYALAGQYILARRSIITRLKGGALLYYPDTPAHHDIKPHVWLETDTHFIDCSTLPRWGYIAVIPLQQVARSPASVIPEMTRLLILEERNDPEFLDYVARHRARFERILRGAEPGHE